MTIHNAADIRPLRHREAEGIARTEHARLLAVLEDLSGGDWEKTTYCAAWNVKQMTAHLAGSVTGSRSLSDFLHQTLHNPYLRSADQPVDGINRLQVEERADKSPGELVVEFRRVGPVAVRNRSRLPWLVRQLPMPLGPGWVKTVGYLMDVIYPRDQWMHRYDICAATGRKMVVTPDHDGRILELVLLDISRKLRRALKGRRLDLHVTGSIAGGYRFGKQGEAEARVKMDVFNLHLLASGRTPMADAVQRAEISGDRDTILWFLDNLDVVY